MHWCSPDGLILQRVDRYYNGWIYLTTDGSILKQIDMILQRIDWYCNEWIVMILQRIDWYYNGWIDRISERMDLYDIKTDGLVWLI